MKYAKLPTTNHKKGKLNLQLEAFIAYIKSSIINIVFSDLRGPIVIESENNSTH